MKFEFKSFLIGILVSVSILACSMGSKPRRLIKEVDHSKMPWEWCLPEMIKSGKAFFEDGTKVENHKGNLCLVECEKKLKKDGTCEDDLYKYPAKNAEKDHDFFMGKFINIPEYLYY